MECRGCRRENRAGSRFCDACGGVLAVRCPACDREFKPDARFCDGCGTSVGAGGAPTQESVTPRSDTEAVRKTVTVLFCDLVGSTAFAESVDTESAREAMSRSARNTATGTTVAQLPEPVPAPEHTNRSQHVHYEPGQHTRISGQPVTRVS